MLVGIDFVFPLLDVGDLELQAEGYKVFFNFVAILLYLSLIIQHVFSSFVRKYVDIKYLMPNASDWVIIL